MKTQAQKILTELRNKHKISSDEEIAIKLRVSWVTIYRWRLGKCNPSFAGLKLLKSIAREYLK